MSICTRGARVGPFGRGRDAGLKVRFLLWVAGDLCGVLRPTPLVLPGDVLLRRLVELCLEVVSRDRRRVVRHPLDRVGRDVLLTHVRVRRVERVPHRLQVARLPDLPEGTDLPRGDLLRRDCAVQVVGGLPCRRVLPDGVAQGSDDLVRVVPRCRGRARLAQHRAAAVHVPVRLVEVPELADVGPRVGGVGGTAGVPGVPGVGCQRMNAPVLGSFTATRPGGVPGVAGEPGLPGSAISDRRMSRRGPVSSRLVGFCATCWSMRWISPATWIGGTVSFAAAA